MALAAASLWTTFCPPPLLECCCTASLPKGERDRYCEGFFVEACTRGYRTVSDRPRQCVSPFCLQLTPLCCCLFLDTAIDHAGSLPFRIDIDPWLCDWC